MVQKLTDDEIKELDAFALESFKRLENVTKALGTMGIAAFKYEAAMPCSSMMHEMRRIVLAKVVTDAVVDDIAIALGVSLEEHLVAYIIRRATLSMCEAAMFSVTMNRTVEQKGTPPFAFDAKVQVLSKKTEPEFKARYEALDRLVTETAQRVSFLDDANKHNPNRPSTTH